MRKLAVLLALTCAPLVAQQAVVTSVATETSPLAVGIAVPVLPKGVFPDFVTVTVTNTGKEPLRLPMPGMGGPNAASGSVKLTVNGEEPKYSATPSMAPEKWQTLAPGESLNFAERMSEVTSTSEPGEYVLRATYTPPSEISPEKTEEVYRESEAYPREAAESAPLTLHREEGQASVVLRPMPTAPAPAPEQ